MDRMLFESEGLVVFDDGTNCLLKGDVRSVLPLIPDGFFDAIITDPPYGIGFADYDTDKASDLFFELEDEFFRVLKPNAWFVFRWSPKRLPEVARFKRLQYRWLMVVNMPGRPVSSSIVGWRTYFPVLVFSKGNPSVYARRQDSISGLELPQFYGHRIGRGGFKPTYAQAVLLSTFGVGGVVFDPFAGFGSLLVVNRTTGVARTVVGVEKDPERTSLAKEVLERLNLNLLHPKGKNEGNTRGAKSLESLPLFAEALGSRIENEFLRKAN